MARPKGWYPDGVSSDEPDGPMLEGKLQSSTRRINRLEFMLAENHDFVDRNDLRDYYKSFLFGERGPVAVGNDDNPINRILNGKKHLADLYEMCLTHLMDFYFESEDDNGFIDVLNDVISDYDEHSFEVEFIVSILNQGLIEFNRLRTKLEVYLSSCKESEKEEAKKQFVEGYFFMWKYWINKAKSLNF